MMIQRSTKTHRLLLWIVGVLLLTNLITFLYWNSLTSSTNTTIPTSHEILELQTLHGEFTVDDFLYIYYGEGRSDERDPALLRYIDSRISRPNASRPRVLGRDNGHFSQIGQSQWVDDRLKQRRNGFFVECGAFDGEAYSNSLFFELERNWTGVLIEANPSSHHQLLKKNRKSLALNACLSNKRTPGQLTFKPADILSGIAENIKEHHAIRIAAERAGQGADINVECFSLNSIMAAIGVNHIDYFSLDVEGAEVEILKTIDWNTLRIDILTIEFPVATGALEGIRNVFKPLSFYKEVHVLAGQDVIFERTD